MASKRNAALEALLGAGYAPAPETPPAAPAEEGSATVVAMHPVKDPQRRRQGHGLHAREGGPEVSGNRLYRGAQGQ